MEIKLSQTGMRVNLVLYGAGNIHHVNFNAQNDDETCDVGCIVVP